MFQIPTHTPLGCIAAVAADTYIVSNTLVLGLPLMNVLPVLLNPGQERSAVGASPASWGYGPSPICPIGQGVRKSSKCPKSQQCALCPRYTYSAGGPGATCNPCTKGWWRIPILVNTAVERRRFSIYRPGGWTHVEICGVCPAGYGLYGILQCVLLVLWVATYSAGRVQGPCTSCAANSAGYATSTTGATSKSACRCAAGKSATTHIAPHCMP